MGRPRQCQAGVRYDCTQVSSSFLLTFVLLTLSYSIAAVDNKLPASRAGGLLGVINHVLNNETAESETIYRAGVALGNLLSSPIKGNLGVGAVKDGKQVLLSRAKSLKEKRLTDLALEVSAISA